MSGVQSIERAFAILRVLSRGPAGVTEVADYTDLPKSTVSRLLTALEVEGAVSQVEDGAEYVIGETLQALGGTTGSRTTLSSVIRPFLEELSANGGGSAGFTVLDGDEMYLVDNVDDDAMVQVSDLTGQSFPLHTVPTGIAMLAVLGGRRVDAYLSSPLEEVEGKPLHDRDDVRALVADVRRSGVVVSHELIDPGINSVAAAFRGPSGEWEGAIYLQGPSFRFPRDGEHDLAVKLVVEAAALVSERFDLH